MLKINILKKLFLTKVKVATGNIYKRGAEMSSKMMGFDEFPQIARTETARAIYLIDVDTCEIVYMNKSAKDMLQLAYEDDSYCGKKCYTVLQGLNSKCRFCRNNLLTTESAIYRSRAFYSIIWGVVCVLKFYIILRKKNWNSRKNIWIKNWNRSVG